MFPYLPAIEPEALHRTLREPARVRLIDVRSPAEYAQGHVAGAVSLPLATLERAQVTRHLGPTAGTWDPVYLMCESGTRAEQAAYRLRNLGLDNVAIVAGGTLAWQQAGLPLQRTAPALPLEHQAQVAVGLILLLVLAKAMLLHPVFYVLLGALGAALIAAGLSGRLSLTHLVSRLPWNRTSTAGAPGPDGVLSRGPVGPTDEGAVSQ